jgi:plastocyanin
MRRFYTAGRCTMALAIIGLLTIMGCGSTSSSHGATVRTVNIGQNISPLQLNAGRGDEVRWLNQRAEPVAVIIPTTEAMPISCLTGFTHVDRTRLSAVIPPKASASLCFAEMGKYDYRVRLDVSRPGGDIDRAASISVVAGGERNPGPVEQFENITP